MSTRDQDYTSGFTADVKAIEQNMLTTQQLLRDATFELNARQRLIESYQRKNYDHERMVGKLYELLKADDMDGAMDIVRDEYCAIHGPSDRDPFAAAPLTGPGSRLQSQLDQMKK